MAVFGVSLNGPLDGSTQTALIRFTVDDSAVPTFLAYFRNQFVGGRGGVLPPSPPPTDVAVFKQWGRSVISTMQAQIHQDTVQQAANNAAQGVPPPPPVTES
jgi:hypothetical protein